MEFALYRFEFERTHTPVAQSLFPDDRKPLSADEAFSRKQQLLADLLKDDQSGTRKLHFWKEGRKKKNGEQGVRKNFQHEYLLPPTTDGMAIVRIDAERKVSVHPVAGSEHTEKVPDWRSCHVVIDNRDGIQCIAIEEKKRAFGKTDSVAAMLARTFNEALAWCHLKVNIVRPGDARDFWAVVGDRTLYPDGFDRMQIELPHPNSEILKKNLSEFLTRYREKLRASMKMVFVAEDGASLDIRGTDEELRLLIDVCINYVKAESIKLRPRGKTHYVIITKDSKRSLDIPKTMLEQVAGEAINGNLFEEDSALVAVILIMNNAEK